MFRRKPNRDDIDRLIARKSYGKAIHWTRRLLDENPNDFALRRQLAELQLRIGNRQEALDMLRQLASDFSDGGFVAKAIVVLKRIQTLADDDSQASRHIDQLIGREGSIATPVAPGDPSRDPDDDTISLVPLAFSESPLFRRFSAPEMRAVVESLEALSAQAGEIVVSEGQPGECLYLIVSGSVRVYVRNQALENVQVRVLSAGDFFGEISLKTGKARTATITTIEPTELLALDRKALDLLRDDHPEIPHIIDDFCKLREHSPEELEARGEAALRAPARG